VAAVAAEPTRVSARAAAVDHGLPSAEPAPAATARPAQGGDTREPASAGHPDEHGRDPVDALPAADQCTEAQADHPRRTDDHRRWLPGQDRTACEVAAAFEDAWLDLHAQLNPNSLPGTRDLHAPVAYVQTPVTAKPKSTREAILDYFGADHHKMTLPQLTRTVRASLHDHGSRVLLLDDITRLKLHRADDQDTLDLIRALMSMHTTLVLIGVNIPGSGLLRDGHRDPRTGQWVFPPPAHASGDDLATQTERRFDLVHLEPFRYDTAEHIAAWIAHLAGLEQHLRLFAASPGMLAAGTMPEYLFRRTGGVVGLLERLIEEGCAEALDTGTEQLTEDLLDGIAIHLGNDPRRDRAAGEVPAVPATTAPPAAHRRRKRRNTVFDDHGPAAPAVTADAS
jgi:hypothetical protein